LKQKIKMSASNSNKNAATSSTKLPKGEFPSNIHILKGATAENSSNTRGMIASEKAGKGKSGKLFAGLDLDTLPKFKDVPAAQRIELFKAKLLAC